MKVGRNIWFLQCAFQWKISSSNIWRCFGWKSICRYFITPAQSKHYSGSSSFWRNCGALGVKHHHLFWSCPLINNFWIKIQSELEVMLNMQIPFNWDELIFGLLHSVDTDRETRCLLGILSLAARKAITKKWLSSKAPTLEDWHQIVYGLFIMERITYANRFQSDKFDKIWDKWKKYIMSKHPEFI